MEINASLADVFFADLQTDPTAPTNREVALRSWLWFTCPAELRTKTEAAIRADPRWQLDGVVDAGTA